MIERDRIQVCARSDEFAVQLAGLFPSLNITVQISEPDEQARHSHNSRINVQRKTQVGLQVVKDAAVYLLRFSDCYGSLRSRLSAELHAHLSVLQASPAAKLILAPPLLPECGTVMAEVETIMLVQDFSRSQLTNEPSLNLTELMEMISGICDSSGRLVVEHTMRFRSNTMAIVTARYERYSSSESVSM